MSKRTASVIAGLVTALILVLVIGVAVNSARSSQVASAAASGDPAATGTVAVCVSPTGVAALQAEITDYQAALQQANEQLQAAYNQIAALQGQRRFRGDD